ncbi:hypothetical protein Q8A73_014346 [Channa argus]|nr:hypothetical protein Q8A73_014346 [Channa argus]
MSLPPFKQNLVIPNYGGYTSNISKPTRTHNVTTSSLPTIHQNPAPHLTGEGSSCRINSRRSLCFLTDVSEAMRCCGAVNSVIITATGSSSIQRACYYHGEQAGKASSAWLGSAVRVHTVQGGRAQRALGKECSKEDERNQRERKQCERGCKGLGQSAAGRQRDLICPEGSSASYAI